jgi:biotin synthase
MMKTAEYLDLYEDSLENLISISEEITSKNFGNKVEFCSLISARTGKCSQNCKYCAQSSHYRTEIETHPLVSLEDVKKTAQEARNSGASRFAIVTSGKTPDESDFGVMLDMIGEINSVDGLKSCASIGILNREQVQALKEAGLRRFHHNINTCRSYYPSVCTTHTYDDRIKTIELVKENNLELCSRVILGMGETRHQRVEMALELREINPDSVPLNFLYPIQGTPFESYLDKIDEEEILKTIAIFRIIMPAVSLRYTGGRLIRLSKKAQRQGMIAGVDSVLIGNMLTTIGIDPKDDLKMVTELNKELVK